MSPLNAFDKAIVHALTQIHKLDQGNAELPPWHVEIRFQSTPPCIEPRQAIALLGQCMLHPTLDAHGAISFALPKSGSKIDPGRVASVFVGAFNEQIAGLPVVCAVKEGGLIY